MTAFLTMPPFFTKEENTNININIGFGSKELIQLISHPIWVLCQRSQSPFVLGLSSPKPQYSPYTIRRMSKIEPSFLPLSVLGPSPPVKFSPILHGLRVFHSGDSHDDISTMFSHPETLQRPKQHSVVPFSYLHFVHRVTWLLQDLLGALIITLLIRF